MRGYILSLGVLLGAIRTTSAISVVSGGVEYIGRLWNETLAQETFLGIPYAQAGRFQRPVAPTVSSPFNATEFGDICPQSIVTEGVIQSEDCLSINIWRPVGTSSQSALPVMVFIYGGSYTQGFSAIYPMSDLGDVAVSLGKPIVGVVFNYRTGFFGFPVGAKAEENGALNLALYDQRAALEWVKNHIADFGGDSSKITIFGHSAGGVSVGLQMLYNGGQISNVFHRAIMQSGSPNTFGAQPASTPARETAYSYLVNNTGCATATDTFACLKGVSFDTLNAAHLAVFEYQRDYIVLDYPWSTFTPTIAPGDSFVPIRPYTAISQGKFAKIPFISGTVLDEGTIFIPVPQSKQDTIDFLTMAIPGTDFGFSDDVPLVTKLVNNIYSDDPADGSPYGTGNDTFGTSQYWKQATSIAGDLMFEAPRRFFLRKAVQEGLDVWSYLWLQPINITEVFPPKYGVSHAQDIYAEFRNWSTSPEGLAAGAILIDYLTAFAYTGTVITPATAGLPSWQKYSKGAKSLQLLYNNYKMVPDTYRSAQIDWIISKVLPVN